MGKLCFRVIKELLNIILNNEIDGLGIVFVYQLSISDTSG